VRYEWLQVCSDGEQRQREGNGGGKGEGIDIHHSNFSALIACAYVNSPFCVTLYMPDA